jgi:hypothetical protein
MTSPREVELQHDWSDPLLHLQHGSAAGPSPAGKPTGGSKNSGKALEGREKVRVDVRDLQAAPTRVSNFENHSMFMSNGFGSSSLRGGFGAGGDQFDLGGTQNSTGNLLDDDNHAVFLNAEDSYLKPKIVTVDKHAEQLTVKVTSRAGKAGEGDGKSELEEEPKVPSQKLTAASQPEVLRKLVNSELMRTLDHLLPPDCTSLRPQTDRAKGTVDSFEINLRRSMGYSGFKRSFSINKYGNEGGRYLCWATAWSEQYYRFACASEKELSGGATKLGAKPHYAARRKRSEKETENSGASSSSSSAGPSGAAPATAGNQDLGPSSTADRVRLKLGHGAAGQGKSPADLEKDWGKFRTFLDKLRPLPASPPLEPGQALAVTKKRNEMFNYGDFIGDAHMRAAADALFLHFADCEAEGLEAGQSLGEGEVQIEIDDEDDDAIDLGF